MPGYSFQVTATLTNPQNNEQVVSIPRGTIFEPKSTHLSYQSAIITRDYVFRLNPKETRSVILDAECWNKNLSVPKKTPGKVTPYKGKIKKSTDIWKVSNRPVKGTVFSNPSQDGHVFTAFSYASPKLARKFLKTTLVKASQNGIDVNRIEQGLLTISDAPSSKEIKTLCDFAKFPPIEGYIKAKNIREFFILEGGPTENNMKSLISLVTNLYSQTSDRLIKGIYDVIVDLRELLKEVEITIPEDRQKELLKIARQKTIDVFDIFPQLDQVKWN